MALGHLGPPSALLRAITLAGATATLVLLILAPRLALAPALLCVIGLGGVVFQRSTAIGPLDLSRHAGARECTIVGTVMTPPDDRGWRRQVRVEVEAIALPGREMTRAAGRTEARVPRKAQLAIGDRVVLMSAEVQPPPATAGPEGFDYRGWLARQGVHCLVSAREVEVIGRDPSAQARLMRLGVQLRQRVVSAIEAAMPGADGALYSRLLVGMVYGLEAAPLPEEIVEQFRRAGTVHLLVVSGAQISMLAIAIVGLTGGSFGRMLLWPAALTAIAVLLLVAIVGMEASVGRAVAMFALVLIAAVSARDYDVYTALGLAAALILLTDPQALLSLSFQLTFVATLGVVVFVPRDRAETIPGIRAQAPLPQIRGIVWGTAGAWALTSPLLAHHFSAFALSGNLANLLNVPLSGVVLILGFIALPIALVPTLAPLLTLLCALARVILRLVMHVNDLAAALPAPFVEGVQLGAGGCVACYAILALALALGLHRSAQRALDGALVRLDGPRAWWMVGALAALPVVTLLLPAVPPREMEVTLLPVGAGQCGIVRSPSGGTLMLDCGGGNQAGAGREVAEGIVLPWLVRRRIERIDALCVSHWDADHCNALPTLLEAMPVETLLLPPELPGAEPPEELRSRRLLPVAQAIAGGRLDLGEGVTAELLAPRFPLLTEGRDDANANSVVMMLAHGDVRVLLTGDADRSATTRLIRDARNSGRSLYADVLVLPHHGRRLAEYEALLDAVAPTWAIVSCDEDAGRYLGDEALALLQRRGIGLLRTDEHGAVTICSDGRAVAVTTSRGAHSPGSRLAAARG